MSAPDRTKLAVWGDPIAHSQSPHLHRAAYAALGRTWTYTRQQVNAETFDTARAALDATWRGLSLTMPLKECAFAAADTRDEFAQRTGAVNTLSFVDGVRGYNTDVGGIMDALREASIESVDNVRILGSGATAASALVAAHALGATRCEILARRPERAAHLLTIAADVGMRASAIELGARVDSSADVTFATLPSGTVLDTDIVHALADNAGALFEAAYAPWPSNLAENWANGAIVSGLAMLLHQAVRQIRVFTHGDQNAPIEGESAMIGAMRLALVGD